MVEGVNRIFKRKLFEFQGAEPRHTKSHTNLQSIFNKKEELEASSKWSLAYFKL